MNWIIDVKSLLAFWTKHSNFETYLTIYFHSMRLFQNRLLSWNHRFKLVAIGTMKIIKGEFFFCTYLEMRAAIDRWINLYTISWIWSYSIPYNKSTSVIGGLKIRVTFGKLIFNFLTSQTINYSIPFKLFRGIVKHIILMVIKRTMDWKGLL